MLLEKTQATQNESENDTHSAQSQERNDTIGDGRRKVLRIGQWPASVTSALAPPPTALERNDVIRRTGTDLQNEEDNVGSARFRLSSIDHTQMENEVAETSQPLDTSSTANAVSGTNLKFPRDYYQFEWFWILIVMMVLINSAVIIHAIVLLEYNGSVLWVWESGLVSVSIGLGSSTIYAGTFVVLMEYHGVIEKAGTKYARLPLSFQNTCLRVCAYVYVFWAIAGVVLVHVLLL